MQREETVEYENTVLRKGIRTDEITTTVGDVKSCHPDNTISLSRIKCLVCVMFAMLIVLYIAVFVAIGLFALYTPVPQVDGNWAQWSEWTPCDVTCGNGSQLRFRTCTNPAPNTNGVVCVGNVTESSICQLQKCLIQSSSSKRHHVRFSVRLVDKAQYVNQNELIVFNEISSDNMNGYDNSSGIFKAKISGVYLFIYFIEIDGANGKVEMRLNNRSISTTTLYGMYVEFDVSGFNHNITFESTKIGGEETVSYENLNCLGETISVAGFYKNVTINQAFNNCPYNGVKATGGNSVVVHVNSGDQVWIQNPERWHISVRPYGTTFTGILLTED